MMGYMFLKVPRLLHHDTVSSILLGVPIVPKYDILLYHRSVILLRCDNIPMTLDEMASGFILIMLYKVFT